jgi:serine/threonine protein kinase/ABC-type glycerol-3-phosphate transport system substrate-binding protein
MSLSRLLAEGAASETQVCPTHLLTDPVLTQCQEWQAAESTKYDCSNDEYLASFTPGQYAGVTANYLSFNTAQSTGHFVDRAKLFEACTGGTINFAEATDIAEDPIKDIGSAGANGAELYDAYLMIYSFTSEASSLGLLETLNDRIRASNNLLMYEDMFAKVRSMGEYRKDGKTNIDLLMADGDFFVPVVRIDLLEREGLPLPHTWDDLVEIAQRFNGTDLNDDDDPNDFGFCIYPRTGSGFNDAWIPELMYSTWATTDQTRGIQQGFFFDEETFEPRIGNGFEKAMDVWKDLWGNSADGCITNNFVAGRCAIGIAPPGCWKGTFVNSEEGGVARRDGSDWTVLRHDNGTALWRPTMKDGSYAEPYRLRPFGSLQVVDRETDEFVDCGPETCPKGEKIKASSALDDNDRAKILVDSPHVGKTINRVPFYWSGGYGTGIRKSADQAAKDLMWDFFVYVNTPITSVQDVVLPSWLDSWRNSQLSHCDGVLAAGTWHDEDADQSCNFRNGGWSEQSFREHKVVMDWALGNDVNSALTLRLPGVLTYSRDVMLELFQQYMAGEIEMDEVKEKAIQGWNDATASQGKLNQVQIYRASLGLDPLTEFDLCQLHREEMDKEDNTVCVKYDPKEEESNNNLLIVAVLVPVLVVAVLAGLGVWIYLERKRRHADAIWKIEKDELKFHDPPEIAGRGTFGLVVQAEYRGTVVAVKRVIPPKERSAQNKTASFVDVDPATTTGMESVDMEHLKSSTSKEGENKEERRKSLDLIFNADEENGGGSGSDEVDLESGTVATPVSVVKKSGKPVNPLSSVESGVSVLSGSKDHHTISSTDSSGTNGKNKWKKWFGYKNGGKNYEQLKQELVVEMRTLSKLRHPCITTVMGCVIDQKEEPMLVMEFMAYGSLFDLLHNDTIVVDGELISPILQDIARGMRFLHAADPKIIHGDLKAANVLVDGRFRAKIADFGLSAKKKYLGATGTPYWMAPELLRRETTNTAESDVYSFGIILYELYSRKIPYEGEDPATVLNLVCDKKYNKRPPVPKGCPSKIAEIMQECIDASPEKRPTFEEIDLRIQRLDSDNVEPGDIQFGHQLKKKERRLSEEENLIHQVFPKHVAEALMQGRKVEADRVEMATMFFSDIVGFTTISSKITPEQVSEMLDRLYLKFDELSVKHDMFKIETIGDAYVGVCNLVKKQDSDHAKRVAEFAIECVQAASETTILNDDPSMGTVKIRVGMHCGPLVARVVGSRNPRYCVFGDTVNTTARMESNSLPMRIQCSDRCAEMLKKQAPELTLESRGMIPIKGKGEMSTFFIAQSHQIMEQAVAPGEVLA